jgi:hypothetical protein
MLKIYSHPRSGTHFLEAFIAENFYPEEDLSEKKIDWGHWSNRKTKDCNPYGQLFGNHKFPSKRLNRYSWKPKLYIYRDGRSVAYSIYKTPNFLNSEMSKLSFSEFLREPLDWWGTPGTKNKTHNKLSIIEHWALHIAEWHHSNENIVLIKYEDLVDYPEDIYRKIRNRCFPRLVFNEVVLNHKHCVKKINKPTGLLPNKAIKNSWTEVFSEQDLKFFNQKTPEWLRSKF